jgi:hypothetical protein
MKPVSTRTNLLLLTAFAMGVIFYVSIANLWFVLSCIFLGLEIVFSFLTVLSRALKEKRRGKLILMTSISAIAVIILAIM